MDITTATTRHLDLATRMRMLAGDICAVKAAIKAGAFVSSLPCSDRSIPGWQDSDAVIAARSGSLKMLKLVLQTISRQCDGAFESNSFQLLEAVCSYFDIDTIEQAVLECLKYGINIDQVDTFFGHTALYELCVEGYYDFAMVLLKLGASANIGNSNGVDALTAALAKKCNNMRPHGIEYTNAPLTDLVRKLINRGANVNNYCAYREIDPLSCAIEIGCHDIVELLLANGANPNYAYGQWRIGPMKTYFLCNGDNIEIVRTLLRYGTDPGAELLYFVHHPQYREYRFYLEMDLIHRCADAWSNGDWFMESSSDQERERVMSRLTSDIADSIAEFVFLFSGDAIDNDGKQMPMLYPDLMLEVTRWLIIEHSIVSPIEPNEWTRAH